MKSKKEAKEFGYKLFQLSGFGGPSNDEEKALSEEISSKRKSCHHFGKVELNMVLDFIYKD